MEDDLPPTLDYASPGKEPKGRPTHPVVGVLGVLAYGALFLAFSFALIGILPQVGRGKDPFAALTVVFALWVTTLWRCLAALQDVLESKKK